MRKLSLLLGPSPRGDCHVCAQASACRTLAECGTLCSGSSAGGYTWAQGTPSCLEVVQLSLIRKFPLCVSPAPHLLFCLLLTSPQGRMVNIQDMKGSTASVRSAPLWTEPSQGCSWWELGKSKPGSSQGPGRWHLFLRVGQSFFIDLFSFEVCFTVETRKACISFCGGSGGRGLPRFSSVLLKVPLG